MTQRCGVLDFWRGIVLMTIFVNHVPGNMLELLTYRNVSLSDSAEAFVFLSGLSLALAYAPKLPDEGFGKIAWRCLSRAFALYRVHLSLTLAAVAISAAAYLLSDDLGLLEAHGRGTVFNDTPRGVTGVVLLGHQLGYFNILPLYVVLMLWAPAVLVLARRHVGLALGTSLAIYASARLWTIAPPSWPEPGGWFFNPFAWQLLFTLGVVAGLLWRDRPVNRAPALFGAALAVLVAGAVIVSDAFRMAPGLFDALYVRLDLWKQDLGLVRLIHFLALAYVLSQIRVGSVLSRTVIGQELQRIGRQSLPIFVAGSVLSALGQAAMGVTAARHNASPELVGTVYTLAGAAALVVLARFLEWRKGSRRRAEPRAVVFGAPLSALPSR